MNSVLVIFIIISLFRYSFLCCLLGREKSQNSKWINNPYIYTLSLAVYCTAWTYYGSIGVSGKFRIKLFAYLFRTNNNYSYMDYYFKRKIIRISRVNKISSHWPILFHYVMETVVF